MRRIPAPVFEPYAEEASSHMVGNTGATVDLFESGTTNTTKIGFTNRNDQLCTGNRGVAGTDHGQVSYRMACMLAKCGHVYGANGTDVFQRKCPSCQGGVPGIDY